MGLTLGRSSLSEFGKTARLAPTRSPAMSWETLEAASFIAFHLYGVVWWIIWLDSKDFGQKSHTALPTFLFVLRSQESMCVVRVGGYFWVYEKMTRKVLKTLGLCVCQGGEGQGRQIING